MSAFAALAICLSAALIPSLASAYWTETRTYSGTNTYRDVSTQQLVSEPWDSSGNNLVAVGSFIYGTGGTVIVVGTVTITKTWVAQGRYINLSYLNDPYYYNPFNPLEDPLNADPNNTNPEAVYYYDADAPPDNVVIEESANAGWYYVPYSGYAPEDGYDAYTFSGSTSIGSIGGTFQEIPWALGYISDSREVSVSTSSGFFSRTITLNATVSSNYGPSEYVA